MVLFVYVHVAALQCSGSPAGALHPVRGLLETFRAGPGCAARESGSKETHLVAVGQPTHGNQVSVVLKPLTPPPPPDRRIILLLISKQPVSPNSTVASSPAMDLRLQRLCPLLPFPPPAEMLRWALRLHGRLSSMSHTPCADRVYARFGEDPSAPQVCSLQPLFLSPHYLTSDLHQQAVRGCVGNRSGEVEVHVIRLLSAGSALCGSVQVVVSLVAPGVDPEPHKVVLILSSLVPVHWAVLAPGLHGDVSVHSSTSVSPPDPPQPHLSFSSVVTSDLSAAPDDLLAWANGRGFTTVTSYTEASLSNRFVIRLARGVAGEDPKWEVFIIFITIGHIFIIFQTCVICKAETGGLWARLRGPWPEEDQLRQWLRGDGGAETLSIRCDDGQLSIMLDTHILQALSVPVVAVTLRDPECQAQSNNSHFLLAFPVTSCGTEGVLQGHPRGVEYKNTTRCFSASPPEDDEVTAPPPVQDPASGEGGFLPAPRPRAGPVLALRLFVSKSFQQSRTGPCVVIADHRVYVEVAISSTGPVAGTLELSSCVVSPVSDPQSSPYWPIIQDRCPAHPSLTLTQLWGGADGGGVRELVDEVGMEKVEVRQELGSGVEEKELGWEVVEEE
ncbi:hypothetical protein CRUP_011646 [Coryphaenoides rupestris]|nr:hypothetical protein CRUP_011646 [Coryphaenoides rupestris]